MTRLKSAYEVALERSVEKQNAFTPMPKDRPDPLHIQRNFFVTDSPSRVRGSRDHYLPEKNPEPSREPTPEHRKIYAMRFDQLLDALQAGWRCWVRNDQFGYLRISDLGLTLRMGQRSDLNALPPEAVSNSHDLRDLCDRSLVNIEYEERV